MDKITFITGATSGIGMACASKFAAAGHNLILNGRREDRLKQLKEELTATYNISIKLLAFDVRDREAVSSAIETLEEPWKALDILVNNAGLAVGLNTVQDGVIDDWERMIDTNIKGLLYVSKAIAPLMVSRNKGHIVNIGSIAGKEVYPNGSVYCGSKHAVDALSRGMRMDMVKHNIRVSQVAPGAVETEFSVVRFKGDQEKADGVYQGYAPLTPDDVADAVYYVCSVPEHITINDLVIMPTAQASATVFNKK